MLVCNGLNAAAVASIPVAYAFGALSFRQLLVVAFADRTLSTFFAPAEGVCARPRRPAGAVCGGRRPQRRARACREASAPFVADATSYAVSFGAIAALRTPLAAPPTERRRLRAEVLDGLRFIWAVPFLLASLLQAAGTNVTRSARR
jgi:hypothetical protein